MREPYTNQTAFDAAARHLLRQKAKSVRERNLCSYRGEGGLKCAVGALIDDADYSPKMEGKAATSLADYKLLPGYLRDVDTVILAELQACHDQMPPEKWADDLLAIAARHGLSTTVLDEAAT